MRNLEFREAIFAALKAHAPLVALLALDPIDGTAAIYDHAPQDGPFPYLVVEIPDGEEHDTDDTLGWDTDLVVHSWSRFRGQEEVERIQRVTDDAINRAEPAIVDARIVTLHRIEAREFLDADGLTRHGVHRFRVIIEET